MAKASGLCQKSRSSILLCPTNSQFILINCTIRDGKRVVYQELYKMSKLQLRDRRCSFVKCKQPNY